MEVKLAESFQRNWEVNQECLLKSKHKYKDTEGIISFVYCPTTGEFNLGLGERHKDLVQAFKTPFADFVRGLFIKGYKVIFRVFSENVTESWDKYRDTVRALGLHKYKMTFNESSESLRTQYGWQ